MCSFAFTNAKEYFALEIPGQRHYDAMEYGKHENNNNHKHKMYMYMYTIHIYITHIYMNK